MRRAIMDSRLFPRLGSTWFPLRVTFQNFSDSRDEYGGAVRTWANILGLAGIPANRAPSGGLERRGGELTITEATDRFLLGGYFPQVTTAMRLVADNGSTYDITSVEHDPWRKFTQLAVKVVSL